MRVWGVRCEGLKFECVTCEGALKCEGVRCEGCECECVCV